MPHSRKPAKGSELVRLPGIAFRGVMGYEGHVVEEPIRGARARRAAEAMERLIACRMFQDAKLALKAYTLRKRREIIDWINELTKTLIAVSAVHTQRQVETARRRAVETWLQRNGVITITQKKKVLPIFPEKTAHN
jgi:D-serine deaminase-like pyridoxal phosphate-dependent protein